MAPERTVLVTGCSSGFGLGAALAFHGRGWKVFAALRDPARAPAELQGIATLALDLDDEAQVIAAADVTPRLDCLVNNAGYALTGPFSGYGAAQMRRQMQVNLLGPALLTQRLLPALRAARGRVINVSSVAGETGMPMNALYCASKYALEGLSESLRHELAPLGIQVALVEPGAFRTFFARNSLWGERDLDPAGAEAAQLTGYRAMRERMLAGAGRDPAAVVAAIVRLAEMESMPLRTRVGGDAFLLRAVKRLLPEPVALSIVGAAFRRLIADRAKP
jgi:NAD(P)-dependent dehydrogenase (short-subunit alcohol dehydrogenase family)